MSRHGIAAALLCVGLLGACGSSKSTSTNSTTTTTTASPTTPAVGPAPPSGSLPAVSNATNLHLEPVIGPGSAPAPTTLATKDLIVGKGAAAAASDTVVVQYVGANYTDGKDFDSSWQRGQPATFPLNGVVPGFSQGIVGMKPGGRREIVIPPALGYGATGEAPAVSPNETLVFVVDLLSIQ